jgi:4-amino-4-deoxy-L-arabinose transferase-like glycosyltransferase
LAGTASLHLPSFVASPTLGLLLVLVFARLTCLLAGPAAALLGAALLSCCPFFLLNAASYFSHVPTAFFAVLFVLCGVRFLGTVSAAWALSAGAALGAVGVVRPFTVFSVLIPCAIELLLRGDRRHYLRMPLVLLGGFPFLGGLLFYDAAVTGNPWLTVEAWALPQFHLGLHPVSVNGETVSIGTTIGGALSQLVGLCKWTSPLLCLLYPVAWLWKFWRRQIAFYDFIFPLLVMSYFLLPDWRGNAYGPRYYFDAYPFLVLTVVSAAAAWFPEQHHGSFQASVVAALAGAVIMAIGAFPALAYQFHRIVNGRMELFDLVTNAHLSNVIVIIGAATGAAYPMWMSSGDLTRNGIDLSGSVLYVNDIPGKSCALARVFPERSFYRYELDDNRNPGRLHPISPCPHGLAN